MRTRRRPKMKLQANLRRDDRSPSARPGVNGDDGRCISRDFGAVDCRIEGGADDLTVRIPPSLRRSRVAGQGPANISGRRRRWTGRPLVVVPWTAQLPGMRKRRGKSLPAMMTQLTLSSWETIYRRSLMMAQGTCSAAEYQRMVTEKAAAMQASTLALMTGRGHAAAVAPYLVRSSANARRLRRK